VGNPEKARKFFQACVSVSAENAAGWHGWGMLERRLGNFERARDIFLRGLEKCRDKNTYLYDGLASLARQAGRVDEARYWFREGTQTVSGAAHAVVALRLYHCPATLHTLSCAW
jgi:tetratricopeptide (TPR) repeat protein